MKDIIIVGGGIIGLSSAFYLQRAGHKVTIIDKDAFLDNCSYGNLGYVCPSHFIPLAAPGIIWQGFKRMMNAESPFYVQPSLNAALIDWGFKFVKSANRKNVQESAEPLRDIALFSQQEYTYWASLPGFDFSLEHKGMLEIFQTEKVAEHAKHTVEQAIKLGLDAALLDYESLQKLEQQTRINAKGAIYFKCDSHLYPDKLMEILKKSLLQNGAVFINDEVTGFVKERGRVKKVLVKNADYEANEIVIATGSWSREITAMLDTKIPLMPGRGYSFTLTDSPYTFNRPAILTEGRVALTPMDGNKIRFGGTMEVLPTNAAPRYERVKSIVNCIKNFLPEFDIAVPPADKIWFGYRPCSADGVPYIGRIKKYNNVIVATGHAMLGLSLGAGTGKLVSELMDEKPLSIDLKPFAVERFG